MDFHLGDLAYLLINSQFESLVDFGSTASGQEALFEATPYTLVIEEVDRKSAPKIAYLTNFY